MIEPGELYRYFMVRETATGQELWVLGDARYEVTGDECGCYRPAPGGEYFLAEPAGPRWPWGIVKRLDEVEPLPGGAGVHAVPDAPRLAMSYRGSWRQAADALRGIRYRHFADAGDGQRAIVATTTGPAAERRYVGTLRWSKSDGIISGVGVEPGYRRQGVATRMWQLAHGNDAGYWPHPRHPKFSPVLITGGRAWGSSLPTRRPAQAAEET